MKLLLIAALLANAVCAFADRPAQVRGLISDESGACVLKTQVLLINVRELSVSQTSTDNCSFSFKNLPPGNYELRAAQSWCLPFRKEFKLRPGQSLFLKIRMRDDPHAKVVE